MEAYKMFEAVLKHCTQIAYNHGQTRLADLARVSIVEEEIKEIRNKWTEYQAEVAEEKKKWDESTRLLECKITARDGVIEMLKETYVAFAHKHITNKKNLAKFNELVNSDRAAI